MGAEVFHALHDVLEAKGYGTTVGDEGGYAPRVTGGNAEALELIMTAIHQAGYQAGRDLVLALDVAASELYKDDYYHLKTEGRSLDTTEMVAWLSDLSKQYPIVSIEDGLDESDWAGWSTLTAAHGDRLQVVGDDLLVTNPQFLARGIQEKAANAILIKLNP